jgi:hypothetical protein
MPAKQDDPFDIEVGRHLRTLRLEMSGGNLGEQLGPTSQQKQQRETGSKRVDPARLQQIARLLDVSLQSLYADAAPVSGTNENLSELMDTGSALRLLRAYARIRSPSLQRALANLAEEMAKNA